MLEPRPLHIMHVVRVGFAGGGMENGIINVTNGLSADRFRVSICALDSQETFSERIRRPDSAYYLLPKKEGIEWMLIWRLARLLRRARVDVVHSHNWGTFLYSVLAARLAGVPIIHGEHGKNLSELNETNRPKSWAKRVLGRRVDRLVTVSQAIAAEWTGYGVPPGKIEWIPNGVDVERFHPRPEKSELRRTFGLPEGGFLIGSVGRFDPIKNYEVLIEAFARLAPRFPASCLAFLGDGPREPNLRMLADTLGVRDRVFWLGRRPDPQNFLPALDIFVLPSKSEGMSNVVLEAMASGLPVIVTDTCGAAELVHRGRSGWIVPSADVSALIATITAALNSRNDLTEMGQRARMDIEKSAGREPLKDLRRWFYAVAQNSLETKLAKFERDT